MTTHEDRFLGPLFAAASGDDPIDRLLTDHFRPGAIPARLAVDVLARARADSDRVRELMRRLRVEATARGIAQVDVGRGAPGASGPDAAARRIADRAWEELREYFEGRRTFFDVPVDLGAAPEFQRRVLRAAVAIPYGEARTYTWVAEQAGNPRAVRAAGTALGRNPVPFIVPCHRVLRTGGGLGGYGFGLPMKEWLLDLERHTPIFEGSATTRIVCRVGCSAAPRIRPENRVIFAGVADARSVGYRPCRVCHPGRAAGAA
jgi:O-6-methylguanine DNA methyltransferase